jgi:uncharacterized membrane protein (UPF0127 family)
MVAMKPLRVPGLCSAAILAASLFIFAGCEKPAATPVSAATNSGSENWEPTEAQPRLQTVKLFVGAEQMDAEMCATMRQTETGMMFRRTMGTNDGMIFNLDYLGNSGGPAGFWMKNCFVPLDVAYINPAGIIEEIHPLQVQDTNTVYSKANNIRFALETPQGWFNQHHIGPGMAIRTERGSLMQTFGQK